ncbi:hypothetical protein GCM10012319_61290 [Comamonas sp. KCTC 72670]|nr:hypothetical protein GCM10012319_61290 [Comamonas sp. KCTC 72670]
MPETAEATTITRVSLRAASARSTTPRMRCALPTLVPPNFITLMTAPRGGRREAGAAVQGTSTGGWAAFETPEAFDNKKAPRRRARGRAGNRRGFLS